MKHLQQSGYHDHHICGDYSFDKVHELLGTSMENRKIILKFLPKNICDKNIFFYSFIITRNCSQSE